MNLKKVILIASRVANLTLKFVIILIFALNIKVNAQSENGIEKRISNLLKNEIQLDSLKAIIKDIIYNRDTTYLRKQLKKIIGITSKDKNSKPYVYTLIAYGQFRTKNTIPYLNEAYKIAKENGYIGMLEHIVDTKGVIYKGKGMYDSLLVTLMEAKDIYKEKNNVNELVTILHVTADLYYNVKLYDRAEKIYLEIMKKKGNMSEWKFWRHVVIVNDLGLIEMKRGKYNSALKYFNKSLEIIKKDSTSSRFTIALGYNALQLANCYLKIGKDSLASYYYKEGLDNSLKNNMPNELTALYNIKSELFFNEGKIDSSLVYAKKSFETFKKGNILKNNLLPIYSSFYKVFKKLKDYKKAYTYLDLYSELRDSLNDASQSARYMQVLAENDYQKAAAKVNLLKTKNYFLLIIIVSIFLFLIIVFIYYLKLRIANSQLIDKSLEIVFTNTSQNLDYEKGKLNNEDLSDSKAVGKTQFKLIESLEQFMKREKVFLKNEVSINEVALQLNTNRTYLSHAINLILKKNFVTYINELRIKEAIRRFSSKEYKQRTIEGISQEVGFNNRVSFNFAFKKYTGVLPSYFIKELSKRE